MAKQRRSLTESVCNGYSSNSQCIACSRELTYGESRNSELMHRAPAESVLPGEEPEDYPGPDSWYVKHALYRGILLVL